MKIIYCVLMFYIFGTYTCQNNEEDGNMRMFLRGRPVIPYEPSYQEPLDPAKVAPPQQNKLTLDWTNGYTNAGDVISSDSNGNIIIGGLRSNTINGYGNVVSGDNHVVYGNYNTVSGDYHVIEGSYNTLTGSYNTVFGLRNIVNGQNHRLNRGSNDNNVSGTRCTVTGSRNIVTGDNHVVFGNDKIVT